MLLSYDRGELAEYLNEEELYKYLRVPDKNLLPPEVRIEIEEETEKALELLNPEVVYKEFLDFDIQNDVILISGIPINSHILSRIAIDSESIYAFILTAGKEIEKEIERLNSQGRYFKSQVLDACGSVYVEALADLFMHNIESPLLRMDYSLSARYSPGYCDISLEQQSSIFALLKDENISVILTDTFQMIPEKSISGLFFKVRSELSRRYKQYYIFCRECKNRLCKYYKR